MHEVATGVWHWQAPHPEWADSVRPRVVSSYATDDGERLLLFDPIAPPDDLLARTDARELVVVLTNAWHERDTRTLVERHNPSVFFRHASRSSTGCARCWTCRWSTFSRRTAACMTGPRSNARSPDRGFNAKTHLGAPAPSGAFVNAGRSELHSARSVESSRASAVAQPPSRNGWTLTQTRPCQSFNSNVPGRSGDPRCQ